MRCGVTQVVLRRQSQACRRHNTNTTKSKEQKIHRGLKNKFKKARKEQLVVVVHCEGGGVRVSAAIDDRNEALWGIVPNVSSS